jgi:uncharacterized protein (DUF58 family)
MFQLIPKELLKQVRRIEIMTTRLANDIFSGEYESVFKGQGIEFAEVREYVPGDDIRAIDWNVTARSNHPFIKQYVETRELTVLFAVDVSSSSFFGSSQKLKSEIAAEISAVLAFSAVRNNDKVGLLIFSDRVEKYLPPKKGKKHVLRVIREILGSRTEKRKTSLSVALQYLNRVLTRRAIIFLVSDFIDQNYFKPLKMLSREHDVIGIHLFDPRERTLPKVGRVMLKDAESGKTLLVNTSSLLVRQRFEKQSEERLAVLEKQFKKSGLDRIFIDTSKGYIDPISRFFKQREKRLR